MSAPGCPPGESDAQHFRHGETSIKLSHMPQCAFANPCQAMCMRSKSGFHAKPHAMRCCDYYYGMAGQTSSPTTTRDKHNRHCSPRPFPLLPASGGPPTGAVHAQAVGAERADVRAGILD